MELSVLLEDAERKIEDYQQQEHQSIMTIKLLAETKEKLEMMREENELVSFKLIFFLTLKIVETSKSCGYSGTAAVGDTRVTVEFRKRSISCR